MDNHELRKEMRKRDWHYEPEKGGHAFVTNLTLYTINQYNNEEIYPFILDIRGVIKTNKIYIEIIEEQENTEYIFKRVNIEEIDKFLNHRHNTEISQSRALCSIINEFLNLTEYYGY